MSGAGPAITAVICTHNRQYFLEKSIQSLLDQTLNRDRYEIIVVDNGSTDGTREVCKSYQSEPGFRYIFEPVIGLSQARNTAWRRAAGPYVGYLDDDATAGSRWLEAALQAFENTDPQPWWVGGPVQLDWECQPPPWLSQDLYECLGYLYWGEKSRWLQGRERLVGCNSFFPVHRLSQLGGFDTRLGRKRTLLLSGEETQLQLKIQKAGGALYYHPDVLTLHYVSRERLQPGFYYRRYFWGGYTDVVIRNSLASEMGEAVSLPSSAEELPNDKVDQIRRLWDHIWAALGVGKTRYAQIHGRIYMAYVAGWLRGTLDWHRGRTL